MYIHLHDVSRTPGARVTTHHITDAHRPPHLKGQQRDQHIADGWQALQPSLSVRNALGDEAQVVRARLDRQTAVGVAASPPSLRDHRQRARVGEMDYVRCELRVF